MSNLELGLIRRRSVTHISQTEVAECGLACLAMVAGFYGLKYDLASLRRSFQPSVRGISFRGIIDVAQRLGLSARPLRLEIEDLSSIKTPAVLHWDLNHFVVLESVSKRAITILDPASSRRRVSLSQVSQHFTGVALEILPSSDFLTGNHSQRLRIKQLWSGLGGMGSTLAQVALLTIVLQIFSLALPYYMQLGIDSALPNSDLGLMATLAIGFALFVGIQGVALVLRSSALLYAGVSLSFGVASNIARHLVSLPLSWFEKRHIGDITSRFGSVSSIRQAVTEGTISALLDGLLSAAIFVVMLFYSVPAALISAGAFAIYVLVRVLTFPSQRAAEDQAIAMKAREQSTLIETIRGITTLRIFNRESSRLVLWQNRLTASFNADTHLARIKMWQGSAAAVILGLETVITGWLLIKLAIDGGFSTGMIFAFVAYKVQFIARASSLVDQWIIFKMLGLHLERLADIALEARDRRYVEASTTTSVLKGKLELRNVSFRYSKADPLILDNVSLVIRPGEHVAVTGPSGGGKSTLLKIVLGLVEPEHGQVFVDDVPLAQFGAQNFSAQAAAVMQDDNLFSGSIMDNICFFDETPDPNKAIQCASLAAIDPDIQAMPMQYNTLVGDMGSTLSGGQKQRILLARALYKQPSLLVIDEGTSSLDARLENRVNEAIKNLGISRLIVAHRAETIANADRVVRLDRGKMESALSL